MSVVRSSSLGVSVAQPHRAPYVDLLSELEELRQQAAVLARRLEAAHAVTPEASGEDPSGQVRVVLTAAGRVSSVAVAGRWQSRLAADRVGHAVLAAYREAARRRLQSWATAISHSDPRGESVDPGPGRTSPVPSADPGVPAGNDAIRGLWYLLQDASDRLDNLAQEAAARSEAVVTGTDPHHEPRSRRYARTRPAGTPARRISVTPPGPPWH